MTAADDARPLDTPLVERVKWALQQSDSPIGVYALADLLTRATGRKHFPNSVYRNLHRMRDNGDVLQVVAANGWLLRKTGEEGTTLVLLCSECGGATQLPAGDLEGRIHRLSDSRHFHLAHTHLEMIGLCCSCAEAPLHRTLGPDRQKIERQ